MIEFQTYIEKLRSNSKFKTLTLKPHLIILVGLQGCGKSTFSKLLQEEFSNFNYSIISQDELGSKKHFEEFSNTLENNKNLILDRINHTQLQRKKYITKARENDYKIIIINLNLPLKHLAQNLIQRTQTLRNKQEKHPTFNPSSYKEVTKVLYNSLKDYEPPLEEECDLLIHLSEFDPYCLDISSKYSQFLIIGDIHGCFDEFQELLRICEKKGYNLKNTAIVSVGDLVDKGPKSKEVLDFFFNSEFSSQCFIVRGNHEFKLQRYLRGNNITISHGLEVTIENCKLDKNNSKFDEIYAQTLLQELDSLPFMIKIAQDSYVLHAGIHPLKSLFQQPKEYFLFARTFNPVTHSFNTQDDKKWFEYYSSQNPTLFFGHQHIEKPKIQDNLFGLDGYCVFGHELRGAIVTTTTSINSQNSKLSEISKISNIELISTPAKQIYYEELEFTPTNLIEHLKFLEQQGYLKSSQKKDLILFNYTQKTMYEQYWNSYTMQARGIIFNNYTGEIVARPFGKFFNINENESTQLKNLPLNKPFEVFEKIDGVLGIIYYHNSKWNLTTRGEFDSWQGSIGEKLLQQQIKTQYLDINYTYLCEIIHPKCRVIINYNEEKLQLLSAIHTQRGEELNYELLQKIALKSGFDIVKKINNNLTIKELLNEQHTWSSDFEGVVIKFENGLRVKIKSHSYNSLVETSQGLDSYKLLNFILLKSKINTNLLKNVPEELKDRVNTKLIKISNRYKEIFKEIEEDILLLQRKALELKYLELNLDNEEEDELDENKIYLHKLVEILPKVGELIYKNGDGNIYLNFKHSNCILPFIKSQKDTIHLYIIKIIKNEIKNNSFLTENKGIKN